VWNNIILCYERENITVRYFCGYQHSIVSENGGLIMFKWLNKIFHRKPSPCDNVIILVPLRMNNKFSSVVLYTINNIDVAKGQIIRFERGIKNV
jgi:hypothetical protein